MGNIHKINVLIALVGVFILSSAFSLLGLVLIFMSYGIKDTFAGIGVLLLSISAGAIFVLIIKNFVKSRVNSVNLDEAPLLTAIMLILFLMSFYGLFSFKFGS